MFGNGLQLIQDSTEGRGSFQKPSRDTKICRLYRLWSYLHLVCPRLQINLYIGICLYVSLPWQYDRTTFTIYLVLGPAPALMWWPALLWIDETDGRCAQSHLQRRLQGDVGHDDQANEEERAGQVLLLKGGMYWDSPSTAMRRDLWKKTRTCQLKTMCSVPWVVQQHCST